jgi:cytidine deaminase
MKSENYQFSYTVYDSINELDPQDAWLLNEAREVSQYAYAPYSNFLVGAVAKLANGEIVAGSNQENASYPAGICAERVLLSTAASMFPGIPVDTIAISYQQSNAPSDHPVAPCGICRQSLQEFETRVKQPIRLILAGMEGKIFIIEKASALLPLAFTQSELL